MTKRDAPAIAHTTIKVRLVDAPHTPPAPPYALRFTTGYAPDSDQEPDCTWKLLAGPRGTQPAIIASTVRCTRLHHSPIAPPGAPRLCGQALHPTNPTSTTVRTQYVCSHTHQPSRRSAYIGMFDRRAGVLTVTPATPCGVVTMVPAYHDPRLDTQRTVSAAGSVDA